MRFTKLIRVCAGLVVVIAAGAAYADQVTVTTNAIDATTVGPNHLSFSTSDSVNYVFTATGINTYLTASNFAALASKSGSGDFAMTANLKKVGSSLVLQSGTLDIGSLGDPIFHSSDINSFAYDGAGIFSFKFRQMGSTDFQGDPDLNVSDGSAIEGHVRYDGSVADFGVVLTDTFDLGGRFKGDATSSPAVAAPLPTVIGMALPLIGLYQLRSRRR